LSGLGRLSGSWRIAEAIVAAVIPAVAVGRHSLAACECEVRYILHRVGFHTIPHGHLDTPGVASQIFAANHLSAAKCKGISRAEGCDYE
jgi:hypothetical protein